MNKFILIICSLLLIVFHACIKFDPVSPIPEITYTSIELVNYINAFGDQSKKAILIFDFIDGDADFGVYAKDTAFYLSDSIKFNLFLTDYYKIDGVHYLIEHDTNNPPPNYTISFNPKLTRVGQNKTVKGIITVDIIDLPSYDTIKFDFIIRDRAGNNSNVESTSDLGIN